MIEKLTLLLHTGRRRAKAVMAGALLLTSGAAFSQNVNVAGALVGSGTYATLADAFTAINGGAQTGATITVSIAANTSETVTATLNANDWTTLTVSPSGGASRTVSGNIAGALISLNGADNVIIDGLNSGGNALVLENTNTTTASTITFINDATGNTVKKCTVNGANTSTASGTLFFSNGGGTLGGNDNNLIDNCTIDASGANFPVQSLYSFGSVTAGQENSGNFVTNNNIANFFSATLATAGIYLNIGNQAWTISGNKFYQTASRAFTTGNLHRGIYIAAGDGYTVSNNTIGYATSTATGTYTMTGAVTTRFMAIELNVGTTTPTSVQGNTITAISLSTSGTTGTPAGIFTGIYGSAGSLNIGTVSGNTIGAATGTGAISVSSSGTGGSVQGISVTGTGVMDIRNNTIGSLQNVGSSAAIASHLHGIFNGAACSSLTIQNNTVGNGTADNLRAGTLGVTTSATQVSGINISSNPTTTCVISGNTVQNIASYGSGAGYIRGIQDNLTTSTTLTITISQNTVHDLVTNGTSAGFGSGQCVAFGIRLFGAGGSTVTQNTVYNISGLNTGTGNYVVAGIVHGSTTVTMSPNTISRNRVYGISNAGTSVTATTPAAIVGIGIRSGNSTVNIVNNMVSLGTGITTNSAIVGIWSNAGSTPNPTSTNVYHNTVNITGTAAAGAQPSFCYHRGDLTATTRTPPIDVRNNIFTNSRTGGTGVHCGIGNNMNATASTTNWGTNASNSNIFNTNASTVGYWTTAQTFAGWQTASASDAASYSGVTLTYINPANDLHLNMGVAATVLESNAPTIASVTNDYDNDVRPGPAGSTLGGALGYDFGADEFDGTPLDVGPPSITYTPFSFTCTTGDRSFTATITDLTGVPITGALQPRVYFRKNAGTWFSSQGVLTSGTAKNGVWTFTITAATMGGLTVGDIVEYYVIVQDEALPSFFITSNPAAGLVATNVNTVTTAPTTPNSYPISPTLSGTFTVGAAGTYTTLTAAVNAYNNSCLGGPIVFSLIDAAYPSEVFPISINANPDASATNTLTIKATQPSTIISGSSASAILKLNGADYVTIDGSIGSTTNTYCPPSASASRDLTFSNTAVTALSSGIWISSLGTGAGASNNTIKNCNVQAGVDMSTTATETYGIVSCGSTITAYPPPDGVDNNNNVYENNSVVKCTWGLYLRGGTSSTNTGTVIRMNKVGPTAWGSDQIRKGGIVLQNQNGAVVNGNEVRFVGNQIAQAIGGTDHVGIALGAPDGPSPAAGNFNNSEVVQNWVHDIVCEKTFSAIGISMAANNGAATNNIIANNMIANVRSNGTAGDQGIGINISSGHSVEVVFNSVNMVSADRDPGAATSASESDMCIRVQANSTNLILVDNILHIDEASNTATVNNFALVVSAAAYNWGLGGLDYNDYSINAAGAQNRLFGLGTTGGAIPPTTTLPAWQATFTPAQDANSVNIVPTFASATDLHLVYAVSGPLGNLGTPLATDTDYDCEDRDNTNPDMGADEFCHTAQAGMLMPGDVSFCTADSFAMWSSGFVSSSGSSFSWQSAPFGTGTFSATGATDPDGYDAGLVSASTEYRLVATCATDGSTDFSDTLSVFIGDSMAPAIGCTSVTVTLDASGMAVISPGSLDFGTTDNCGPFTFTVSQDTFTCADLGVNSITAFATDTAGNVSSCSASVTVLASAMSASVSSPTFPSGHHISCFLGTDGSATATPSGGCPAYSYVWSDGQTTATATGLSAGLYTVTVTDAAGQADTLSITLFMPLSAVSASSIATEETCVPGGDGAIDLTVSGGSPGYTYLWSNSATTEDISGLSAGNYTVTVTDTNGCTSVLTDTVDVTPGPGVPLITESNDTLYSSITDPGYTYQWYLGGAPIGGATGTFHFATVSGSYEVVVTDSNGCSDTSAVFLLVNLSDVQDVMQLNVWPNPATQTAYVSTGIAGMNVLVVTDMYGKVLLREERADLSQSYTLDLSKFSAGVYLVTASHNGQRATARLVVQ